MAHNYKKITNQLGISYLFNMFTFIFIPLLTLFLTRTLTVKEFGTYSVLASTISILCVTLSMGIPQYILTKMHTLKDNDMVETLFSILFFQLICIICLFSILLLPFIQNIILSFLKLTDYKFEFSVTLIIILIGTIFNLIISYISSKREINFVSFVSFFYTCFWIILLLAYYLFFRHYNLSILFTIWVIGVFIAFIIILIHIRKDIKLFFTKIKEVGYGSLQKVFVFSLPLLPFVISYWILTINDRYLINYFKGSEYVGIYSLMFSLTIFIFSFPSIITGVIYPYMAKAYTEKKNHLIFFNAQLKYNLIMIIPAMVGLFILRRQIITMISGDSYLVGVTTLIILLPMPLFAALCNTYKLNLLLRDKTKLIAIIYGSGTIINIILNLCLIPKYGIEGAAVSIVISYLSMVLLFYKTSENQLVWDFEYLKIKKIIIISLLMGLSIFFIDPHTFTAKISTILFGIIVYVCLLLLFKIFTGNEYTLIKSLIPEWLK